MLFLAQSRIYIQRIQHHARSRRCEAHSMPGNMPLPMVEHAVPCPLCSRTEAKHFKMPMSGSAWPSLGRQALPTCPRSRAGTPKPKLNAPFGEAAAQPGDPWFASGRRQAGNHYGTRLDVGILAQTKTAAPPKQGFDHFRSFRESSRKTPTPPTLWGLRSHPRSTLLSKTRKSSLEQCPHGNHPGLRLA